MWETTIRGDEETETQRDGETEMQGYGETGRRAWELAVESSRGSRTLGRSAEIGPLDPEHCRPRQRTGQAVASDSSRAGVHIVVGERTSGWPGGRGC